MLVVPALIAGGCTATSGSHQNKAFAMVHQLNESDNNRTISIRTGEKLRITLPENATTGFRWEIERCDRELVGVVAEEPRYHSGKVGSGGHVEFVFQGRSVGVCEIVLKHWRSWEGEASVIARYHLHVNVLQ
jgi:inhibitor of cysteine peptidase